MPLTRLRQQGGALVLTMPSEVAAQMGWRIGTQLTVDTRDGTVCLTSARRTARGRKTVGQLLGEIDSEEIAALNDTVADINDSPAAGKEFY